MHIQARRIFRLSFTAALALLVAYAISTPLPFIAPLFAFFLTAIPGPPLGTKKLLGLVLLVMITLGMGLLLIPLLLHFQLTALLLVLIGLYLSSYLTVNLSKNLPGTFLAIGVTLISAAGTVNDSLATTIIQALVLGIIIAVICQSLIYQLFPEDPPKPSVKPLADKSQSSEPQKESHSEIIGAVQSNWIAIRSTLIVFPAYLLLLSNPMAYMPIIMKAVMLSQQASTIDAKSAGRELIGSTLLGGLFAVLFWFALGLKVNLWMFFLWMLLFTLFFSCKIYQLIATRFPASFWLNTAVTMLIMLGPEVEDIANGKDVYAAFFSRAVLLILITLYALLAVYFLEYIKSRYNSRAYSH
ncbi:MAG: DUF2955 domain-containing protein [gamma proteobacterium symbiont of Bathyaustriella thionipta]|nr:DUF2955 domain-containing protein [gamma proteobacterium symbiont of Bathyaustriella thionipta]MCU7948596.1 DUF2955 domain-containing protein [gamma proteobacterium symbiont of Bathyaustriella thionipta]MCU7953283.1 DUF2955 domain-containing protein [gamma proteobacterium symbiont of Bathyaustriella thionipta]MCU7955102.1 DUF2955 domain-containing protein [gamma proteobacterium symbiont of Bathyaustriella thionipta]MCU7968275.1 DUF2955 domain-containing protein [gamma proteobacterium symbion